MFPCHRARQHEISYCTALERRKGQQGSEHPYGLASESEATYGPLQQPQEASIGCGHWSSAMLRLKVSLR